MRHDLLNFMRSVVAAPNEKQKRERIFHWLSILEQVGLISDEEKGLSLHKQNYKQTLCDLDIVDKNVNIFMQHLFDAYFELSKNTAGIVDIADLREKIALKMLKKDKKILTERQFDDILKRIPLATDHYLISLGRPMGAEEKLFEHKGNYFRTLAIRRHKEEPK